MEHKPDTPPTIERTPAPYKLVLRDTETDERVEVDYFAVDCGEFGRRLNHSIETSTFEQNILSGAIKPDWLE